MASIINVDRNLLFAVIALQDDLIDQTQFADVCAGWAMRLERPLADLLIERGWITDQDKAEVERKLERKLKKHGGDVRVDPGRGRRHRGARRPAGDREARDPSVAQWAATGPGPRAASQTLVPPASPARYAAIHAHAAACRRGTGQDLDRSRHRPESRRRPQGDQDRRRPQAAIPANRFLKEAQITGQLEHPNIVPVYELARRKEDDQPFYTMRFLRGQTLRDAIAEFHRQRAGKPADRLELQRQLLEPFVKVCQAVGYAHSRGVIHRDLKPENVVLGAYGEVVVLDWGLAKIVGEPDSDAEESLEPRISRFR